MPRFGVLSSEWAAGRHCLHYLCISHYRFFINPFLLPWHAKLIYPLSCTVSLSLFSRPPPCSLATNLLRHVCLQRGVAELGGREQRRKILELGR